MVEFYIPILYNKFVMMIARTIFSLLFTMYSFPSLKKGEEEGQRGSGKGSVNISGRKSGGMDVIPHSQDIGSDGPGRIHYCTTATHATVALRNSL